MAGITTQFGRRVQQLRYERGISQEALAHKVGVHRTYMGFIERGERNPTLENIERIAHALGITVQEMFRGFR